MNTEKEGVFWGEEAFSFSVARAGYQEGVLMRRLHVFLLLGLILSVAACSTGGGNGSSTASTSSVSTEDLVTTSLASPSTTVGQATTTSSPAVEDRIVFEWLRADSGTGVVESVAEAGDGFVAVRYPGVDDDSIQLPTEIIVSGDGSEWDLVPESPVAGEEQVMWLSGNKWGVVGVVFDPAGSMDDPDFILSADGITWIRTDSTDMEDQSSSAGLVMGAVWGEPGIVLVYASNADTPNPTTSLYFSETGESWTLIEEPADLGAARTVLASGTGYVVVEELDQPGVPGLSGWFSSDGKSWEPVTIGDAIISGSGGSTGWRDGFVVVRDVFDPASDTYGPRIWESSNGITWSESVAEPFKDVLSSGFDESLQGSDLGLVTLGMAAHDHETEDALDVEQFLMFRSNGIDWVKWNTNDLFGTAVVMQYAIGSESIVVSLIDEDASDFENNAIVTYLVVGRPTS